VAIRAVAIRVVAIRVAAIRTAGKNAIRCALLTAIPPVPFMTIMVSVIGGRTLVKRVVTRNAIDCGAKEQACRIN